MDYNDISAEILYCIYETLTPEYLLKCRLICKWWKDNIDCNNKIWWNLFSQNRKEYIKSGKEIIINDHDISCDTILEFLDSACYDNNVDRINFLVSIFRQGNWDKKSYNYSIICDLRNSIIYSGNPKIIETIESVIERVYVNGNEDKVIKTIITFGNGEVLNYYMTKYPFIEKKINDRCLRSIRDAFMNNNASVLKVLLINYMRKHSEICNDIFGFIISSCRMGRKDVVKISINELNINKKMMIERNRLKAIFTHGNIHILKWIIKYLRICPEDIKLNKQQINRLYKDKSNCAYWIIEKFDL